MTKKTESSKQGSSDLRFGFSQVLGSFGCQFVSDFDIRISDFV
jgi:hypothetical protein